MDALLFMILALVLVIREVNTQVSDDIEVFEESQCDSERVAKLNETFYEDPDAFSEIIHALGFPKE